MKMFVALVSGVLLSSAAFAQHDHGASTGGSETTAEAPADAGGAATGNANANANQPAAAEGAERIICRRVGRTESRVSRNMDELCMTARQWRRFNRDN